MRKKAGVLRRISFWVACIPILLGLCIMLMQNRLVLLITSWLFSYQGLLYLLFGVGGSVAGFVVFRQAKNRQVKDRRIFAGMLTVALLLIMIVAVDQTSHYAQREVLFESRGVELAGSLYRPAGEIKAGVVLVHGSPDFDRSFYHVWADFFAREGVAVLSYDKRGTGRSEGRFVSDNNTAYANLDLLAADAAAAQRLLKQQIGDVPVGFWGLSQGGWIIPIAAQSTSTDFALFASGPTCTTEEEHVYSRVRGDHVDAVQGSREEAEAAVLAHGPGGFDPIPYLEKMDMPALWVFGALDDSIPVRRSVQLLDRLRDEGKPFDYHILPQADHLLAKRTGIPDIDPAYWSTTQAWLKEHVFE